MVEKGHGKGHSQIQLLIHFNPISTWGQLIERILKCLIGQVPQSAKQHDLFSVGNHFPGKGVVAEGGSLHPARLVLFKLSDIQKLDSSGIVEIATDNNYNLFGRFSLYFIFSEIILHVSNFRILTITVFEQIRFDWSSFHKKTRYTQFINSLYTVLTKKK